MFDALADQIIASLYIDDGVAVSGGSVSVVDAFKRALLNYH